MLRDYLTKRKTFRKTVKAAVKEEVKSRVTAARAQELFEKNAEQLRKNDYIESELYVKNNVKRGLRNSNGTGVLVGLTKIGEVIGYDVDEKKNKIPVEGKLYYRGYSIEDLVNSYIEEERFGFEEITYLLILGSLPTRSELEYFKKLLGTKRELPQGFARDIILTAPSNNIMNKMARSVLALYCYDDNPDDTSISNVFRQSIDLIGYFPALIAYAYQAKSSFYDNMSLHLHNPIPELSTSENILRMIRPTGEYTELEARLLDLSMILHAEHGGGNNSSFTTHLISSTGTDTYSAIAAAIGSLKGPKHGGANIKVIQMFQDMKKEVKDWKDEDEVRTYLKRLLHKEAFDRKGLIYGMGHAIYSVSDPRAEVFKAYVETLAREKGRMKDYALYSMVERLAPEVIAEERRIYKGVSANVDFYSGFVYSMLDLPLELYTPMFAVARIVGWSAHRMEELINADKIIRPAYKNVLEPAVYVPLNER